MPTPASQPDDVALSLTLAVVTASPSPLLLLNGDLAIIAASTSFRKSFHLAQVELGGQALYGLSNSAWDMPELRRLLEATLSGEQCDECELELKLAQPPLRHLVVHARRLDYLDLNEIRLSADTADHLVQMPPRRRRPPPLLQRRAIRGPNLIVQQRIVS